MNQMKKKNKNMKNIIIIIIRGIIMKIKMKMRIYLKSLKNIKIIMIKKKKDYIILLNRLKKLIKKLLFHIYN